MKRVEVCCVDVDLAGTDPCSGSTAIFLVVLDRLDFWLNVFSKHLGFFVAGRSDFCLSPEIARDFDRGRGLYKLTGECKSCNGDGDRPWCK